MKNTITFDEFMKDMKKEEPDFADKIEFIINEYSYDTEYTASWHITKSRTKAEWHLLWDYEVALQYRFAIANDVEQLPPDRPTVFELFGHNYLVQKVE